MSLQKDTVLVTRKYSDIDLHFERNASTGDIARLIGVEAVKREVVNLILTRHFERPFHPEIGCKVGDVLFSPISWMAATEIEKSIREVLRNYSRRVMSDLDVRPHFLPALNTWEAKITFHIKNVMAPIVVSVLLDRIR